MVPSGRGSQVPGGSFARFVEYLQPYPGDGGGSEAFGPRGNPRRHRTTSSVDERFARVSGRDTEGAVRARNGILPDRRHRRVPRIFLNHRFSDDLDFFANDTPEFALWTARFIDALNRSAWELAVLLREERFARLMLTCEKGAMKIELVNDVPAHVGEINRHPVLGNLDSAENILANKLTALRDREEPKDLADIWASAAKWGSPSKKLFKKPMARPPVCFLRFGANSPGGHRERLAGDSLDRAARPR